MSTPSLYASGMEPVLWIFLVVVVALIVAMIVIYRRRNSGGSMSVREAHIRGDKDFGGGGVE